MPFPQRIIQHIRPYAEPYLSPLIFHTIRYIGTRQTLYPALIVSRHSNDEKSVVLRVNDKLLLILGIDSIGSLLFSSASWAHFLSPVHVLSLNKFSVVSAHKVAIQEILQRTSQQLKVLMLHLTLHTFGLCSCSYAL